MRDSFLIYKQIITFSASSLISFGVDYGLYVLLGILGVGFYSVRYVLARVVSSMVNYILNRHLVFKAGNRGSMVMYFMVVLIIMALGAGGVALLKCLNVNGFISKLIVDIPLFPLSYYLQRKFVFRKRLFHAKSNRT